MVALFTRLEQNPWDLFLSLFGLMPTFPIFIWRLTESVFIIPIQTEYKWYSLHVYEGDEAFHHDNQG